MAERVRGLIRELAEEQADVRALLERLDAIRLRQADVEDDHFVLMSSRKEYEQAFGTYGLHRNAMTPEQAARALSAPARRGPRPRCWRPWTTGRSWRVREAPEADWLKQVLAACGLGRVASGVRSAARKTTARRWRSWHERSIPHRSRRRPCPPLVTGFATARSRCRRLVLSRRAQRTYPGDFWINQDLGVARADCEPPQYEESIRFFTVAAALRPDSPASAVQPRLLARGLSPGG